jgi:hypothetical protein
LRCDPSVDLKKTAADASILRTAGDLAPEGVLFIPADRNPTLFRSPPTFLPKG